MVIVKIMGGLGNQMFQGALYRQFELLGAEVKADLSALEKYGNVHNGYELEQIFGIRFDRADEWEVKEYADSQLTVPARIKRKLFGIRKASHYIEQQYKFNPKILELRDIYLEGYWQSERYFENIRELIQKQYTFPVTQSLENKNILNQILKSNSVSIHIRRGEVL